MKTAVFIDGGNLYRKLKELGVDRTSQFNYQRFIRFLTPDVPTFVGYYVGQIRKEKNNPKSSVLYSNQQKLFAYLNKSIPEIHILRGHIQNYNGVYKEKGVDVKMSLDLYRLANQNFYDKAILVSSDSDLIPAVKMAQDMQKEVEYIGFAHNFSFALIKECKKKKLLSYEDLLPFIHSQ